MRERAEAATISDVGSLFSAILPPEDLEAAGGDRRKRHFPSVVTCWRLNLNKRSLDREAVGQVTTPGQPPVFLTASELFQNSLGIISANFVQAEDIFFSEDYLSSPEALTLGCWVPVLGKGCAVSRSFSLRNDFAVLEQTVLEQGVTLIAGSGKFFNGISNALNVRSLKYGILFSPTNQREIEDWEKLLDLPLARA